MPRHSGSIIYVGDIMRIEMRLYARLKARLFDLLCCFRGSQVVCQPCLFRCVCLCYGRETHVVVLACILNVFGLLSRTNSRVWYMRVVSEVSRHARFGVSEIPRHNDALLRENKAQRRL